MHFLGWVIRTVGFILRAALLRPRCTHQRLCSHREDSSESDDFTSGQPFAEIDIDCRIPAFRAGETATSRYR
jgi:hypothetical protein